MGEVAVQQPAEAAVGDDVVAAAGGRAQDPEWGGGEHVGPSQGAPHLRQLVEPVGPGAAGDECAVESADGGADDDIGDDAGVGQGPEHPDLYRAEAAAAG